MKKRMRNVLVLLLTLCMVFMMLPTQTSAAVKLNMKKTSFYVGKTVQLKVTGTSKKVTWTSNKKSVATVNSKGKVTGISAGTAIITAKVSNKRYRCTVNVLSDLGTRKNPLNAYEDNTFSFQPYSWDEKIKVSLQLVNTIEGDEANNLAQSENMFNTKPDGTNRYIFYHFKLSYLEGESELEASDIIHYNMFFDETCSASAGIRELATLGDLYGSYWVYEVNLYSGGSNDVYLGILVDNKYEYLTFRVNTSPNTYTWFTTKK